MREKKLTLKTDEAGVYVIRITATGWDMASTGFTFTVLEPCDATILTIEEIPDQNVDIGQITTYQLVVTDSVSVARGQEGFCGGYSFTI